MISLIPFSLLNIQPDGAALPPRLRRKGALYAVPYLFS